MFNRRWVEGGAKQLRQGFVAQEQEIDPLLCYMKELKKHGMAISMTEENHCAENSMAERLNGILKQEYALRCEFRTFRHARSAVKGAVYLYNTRRLHRSLNLQTPEQVHCAV
jgi:putative transposase